MGVGPVWKPREAGLTWSRGQSALGGLPEEPLDVPWHPLLGPWGVDGAAGRNELFLSLRLREGQPQTGTGMQIPTQAIPPCQSPLTHPLHQGDTGAPPLTLSGGTIGVPPSLLSSLPWLSSQHSACTSQVPGPAPQLPSRLLRPDALCNVQVSARLRGTPSPSQASPAALPTSISRLCSANPGGTLAL